MLPKFYGMETNMKSIEVITADELEEILIEARIKCYEKITGKEYITEYYMITGKIPKNDDEAKDYADELHDIPHKELSR